MSVLKTKSIVTAGTTAGGVHLTFTEASIAAFLAIAGNYVEPLMDYLINDDEWFCQPDAAGAYTARSGAKYNLVPSGAKYATMKVGGVTHQLTRQNNTIEATATGIATVTLTNGKFVFGATSGTATNGQKLVADGTGGFVFVDEDAALVGANGQAVSTTVAGGFITSELIVSSTANNVLRKDGTGAFVLVKGKALDAITTSYDGVTGEVIANFNVSPDAGNSLIVRANGAFSQSVTVAAGSAQYAQIVGGELSLKPLAIKDVQVTSGDIDAAWIAANYATGTEFQEGDMIMCPDVSKAYVNNGGTTGTMADFTQIQVPNLTATTVRSWLSAKNGVSYNPTTGEFVGVVAPGNTGLSVGVNGFNFAYQDQIVYDAAGIMNTGLNASATLHNFLTTTATYAKRMWDTTCTYYYMTGQLFDGSIVTKKFFLDGDGHLVYEIHTGGSDFSGTVLTSPF